MNAVFGYGSLTDVLTLKESERITRKVRTEPAILLGWKLRNNKMSKLGDYGYANIQKTYNPKNHVYGKIIYVTEQELVRLDRREGVATDHYNRITITVKTKKHDNMKVFTYVATPESSCITDLSPTRKYYDHIMKGLRSMKASDRKNNFYIDSEYFDRIADYYTRISTF